MNNDFWGKANLENAQKSEELFVELVQKALTGKQSDFDFIRSWQQRISVKSYLVGAYDVVKIFTNLYKSTQQTYLKQIDLGTQDLQTILALKQFQQCKEYYQKEVAIATDMLEEYNAYVLRGHLIDTFLGNIRKEEDLVDFRKSFWRIF